MKQNFYMGSRLFLKIIGWILFLFATLGTVHASPRDDILTVNCPDLITCQYERVSRDFTCLDFKENHPGCVIEGMAGGEHTSFVTVTGNHGDTFRLNFIVTAGSPGFSIAGEGLEIREIQNSKETQIILGKHLEFTIAISAYPYGEYRLMIKKIDAITESGFRHQSPLDSPY